MHAAVGVAERRAAATEERLANIAYQDAVGSARPEARPEPAVRELPLRLDGAEPDFPSLRRPIRLGQMMIGSGGFGLRAIK